MNDFFTDIRNARRKTIDLIFKVLKSEVKNAFISVIEWPRIPAWYLKNSLLQQEHEYLRIFKFFATCVIWMISNTKETPLDTGSLLVLEIINSCY